MSKGTEAFKNTIKSYLDKRAKEDELFAESYARPNKSIDECINFILQEVKKSGCNGFADDEIYGMAVHYYDEENLGNIKSVNCQVVVNHKVELTKEDKEQAYKQAIEKYQQDCIVKIKEDAAKKVAKKKKADMPQQQSLFDFDYETEK